MDDLEGILLFKITFVSCHPVSKKQATGYASQHIWCLSQARINWDGCGRKGIRHKNGGWWRWVADQSGWSGASRIVGVSASVIFPCTIKSKSSVSSGTAYLDGPGKGP